MILRRRRLWFVVLFGLVLAGGAWAWWAGTAISCKDADRITKGMTEDQVAAIIGKPLLVNPYHPRLNGQRVFFAEEFRVIDGWIHVLYDDDAKVIEPRRFSEGIIVFQFRLLLEKLGYY